ncbi:MAG: sensor histidine kinase, partial [Spirochaetales bacterium]|nr:sensor histidine kinase [Spirochaetales bacterium]
SLLSLQAEEARSKDPYEVLLDARGRLQSMMQLYELLNAQASFESVSIRDFLSALTRELTSMFTGSAEVRFLVRVEDFKLGVDRLATLGLIVNEIVTNSLKYAFYETKEPLVSITVTKSDGRITVRCEDNGCGMPVDEARDESHGLGSMLIEMLAGQLRASLRVESDGGTRYTLEFDERAGEP